MLPIVRRTSHSSVDKYYQWLIIVMNSCPGPPALIEANIQVRSMGPISEMDMVCGSCHHCRYYIQDISELLYGLLLQTVLGGQEALLHRVRGEPHHHHHGYHQAWLLECPGSVCRDAQ